MFKDIILSYYRSPSMGSKVDDYKKKLQKDLRWWTFSFFTIIFVFFTIFLSLILPKNNSFEKISIVKNTTTNPNLLYNVKSTAKHILEQNDVISYTLTVRNNSNLVQFSNFEIDLTDALKYADLLDGGDYKIKGKSIYWNTEQIDPASSKSKIFALKMKNKFPVVSQKNKFSTCDIKLFFGNNLSNKIKCPTTQFFNDIISILTIDSSYNLFFIIVLFIVSIIMIVRTNLLYKEISFFSRHLKELQ